MSLPETPRDKSVPSGPPRDEERWEVLDELGRGGMARVYKCRDKKLGRLVAIKRLSSRDEKAIVRFQREAEALAALSHPNIITIYEYPSDEVGPYLVMEFAPGGDLRKDVKAEGRYPEERCVEVIEAVANALAHAHESRDPETGELEPVVHRDIKPSNILLLADGTPKLSDFGLARLEGRTAVTLTGAGMGTPVYMAPEQVEGARNVGPPADLYSLGKTLYFMATGQEPSTIIPDRLPLRFRKIVLRCIGERPKDRFPSAAAFIEALQTRDGGLARPAELTEGECASCGRHNPPDARLCQHCPASLLRECPGPECDREINVWARRCPYCGVDVSKEIELRGLLDEAARLLGEGRIEEATRPIREARERDGKDPRVRELAARLEQFRKKVKALRGESERAFAGSDFDASVRLLEQAVSLSPHDADLQAELDRLPGRIRQRRLKAALALAEQAERNQRPQDAVKAYGDALRIDPECRPAAAGKQRCKEALDTRAKETRRRRVEGVAASLAAGRRALEQERPGEALGHFRQALKLDSSNADARNGMVRAEEALRAAQARRRKRIVLGAFTAVALLTVVLGLVGYLDVRARRIERMRAAEQQQESARKAYHARIERVEAALDSQELDEAEKLLGEAEALLRTTKSSALALYLPSERLPDRYRARLAGARQRQREEQDHATCVKATEGKTPGEQIRVWDDFSKKHPQSRFAEQVRAAVERALREGHRSALAAFDKALQDDRFEEASENLKQGEGWLHRAAQRRVDLPVAADAWPETLAVRLKETKSFHAATVLAEQARSIEALVKVWEDFVAAESRSSFAPRAGELLRKARVRLNEERQARRDQAEKEAFDALAVAELEQSPAEAVNSWDKFLKSHPDGKLTAEARKRLEQSRGRMAAAAPRGHGTREPKLPEGLETAFEIPSTAKDQHDNPIRKGADPKTGWALEIRHKDTGMHFVFIAPGQFMMGSPEGEKDRSDDETQHRVKLTKPLYLAKYETTQAEWKKTMESEPWKGKRNVKEDPSHAASYVSWDDCQELLKKLNAKFRAPRPALRFALPTEAQWEYACRAGAETRYSFGDHGLKFWFYAWVWENSKVKGDEYAHPVGRMKPNEWGLYDMHGNVKEPCQDWFGSYAEGEATDPTGATSGMVRVSRGGSWHSALQYCRAARRLRLGPGLRDSSLGLRLALSPVQQ